MIQTSVRTLTALLLLASAMVAQTVDLPIRDLVTTANPSSIPEAWIMRPHRGEFVHRFHGESRLLKDWRTKEWLSPEEVGAMISGIAGISDSTLVVDRRVLSVEARNEDAAREALRWVRQQLPPIVELTVTFERVVEGVATPLVKTVESIRAGSMITFADVERRRLLSDYEVEIASSSATANPIMHDQVLGTCLAMRARAVPGQEAILIEAIARSAKPGESEVVDLVHEGFGGIDRARRHVDEGGAAFVMSRGSTRVQEWTSAAGDLVRLTLSADWEAQPPRPRADAVVRCGALLAERVASFRKLPSAPDEERPGWVSDELTVLDDRALIISTDSDEMLSDGDKPGNLLAVGSGAGALDRRLAQVVGRRFVPVSVELEIHDVPAGAVEASAGRLLARIASPVLIDYWASFAGQSEMLFVADWDVEVASSARVPDPRIELLTHGYHLDLQVVGDGVGKPVAVELDGTFDWLQRIDAIEAKLSKAMTGGGSVGSGGGVYPTIRLSPDVVKIEKPIVRSHRLATTRPLQDGRAVLRRAAPQLLGDGREILCVIHVDRSR